jgi:hypothetical protein
MKTIILILIMLTSLNAKVSEYDFDKMIEKSKEDVVSLSSYQFFNLINRMFNKIKEDKDIYNTSALVNNFTAKKVESTPSFIYLYKMHLATLEASKIPEFNELIEACINNKNLNKKAKELYIKYGLNDSSIKITSIPSTDALIMVFHSYINSYSTNLLRIKNLLPNKGRNETITFSSKKILKKQVEHYARLYFKIICALEVEGCINMLDKNQLKNKYRKK